MCNLMVLCVLFDVRCSCVCVCVCLCTFCFDLGAKAIRLIYYTLSSPVLSIPFSAHALKHHSPSEWERYDSLDARAQSRYRCTLSINYIDILGTLMCIFPLFSVHIFLTPALRRRLWTGSFVCCFAFANIFLFHILFSLFFFARVFGLRFRLFLFLTLFFNCISFVLFWLVWERPMIRSTLWIVASFACASGQFYCMYRYRFIFSRSIFFCYR